jgi:hypothetical protein
LHYAPRHLLEALRDGVTVERADSNDFQDQQVQRALREV